MRTPRISSIKRKILMGRRRSEIAIPQLTQTLNYTFTESEINFLNQL